MKKDTHPQFYTTEVSCACGNTFTVGSTIKDLIRVETCFLCHPFYTGKQKLVDTAGRVDKFRQRAEARDSIMAAKTKQQNDTKKAKSSSVPSALRMEETEEAAEVAVEEKKAPAKKAVAKAPAKKETAKKPAAKKSK